VNGGRNYDQTVVVPKTKSGYLLEHPVDPALPQLCGDNATGAGNQQERLRVIEESSETVRRTLMQSVMRQSELHGDMQSG